MAWKDKEKEYKRQWYLRNKERILKKRKEHYQNNKERVLAQTKEWVLNNPEKRKIIRERWDKKNRAVKTAQQNKRRAKKLNATPNWLNEEMNDEIKEFYILAKELRWLSEEDFHVDHIVPLQGKEVCGLHVPWNLQLLPKSMNLSKGNK